MTKDKIKEVINNSYRHTSEGYLIDVEWAAIKLESFFNDETERLNKLIVRLDEEVIRETESGRKKIKSLSEILVEIKTIITHDGAIGLLSRTAIINLLKRALAQTGT